MGNIPMEDRYQYNHDLAFTDKKHRIVGETEAFYICEHLDTHGKPLYKTCFLKKKGGGMLWMDLKIGLLMTC